MGKTIYSIDHHQPIMLSGKKILITGGTGSLGNALTSRLLREDVDTIRIFSRNENKQIKMESELKDDRLKISFRGYKRLFKTSTCNGRYRYCIPRCSSETCSSY